MAFVEDSRALVENATAPGRAHAIRTYRER
jgi:hypothetical protein